MGVVQLQDDTGENLGRALGTAAGYFATRKARQAERDYQHQRDTTADESARAAGVRADTASKLYAENITSEIATRNATTARNETDDANTKLQNGLFAKYAPMLESPPKGADIKAWVQSVKQKAFADGLTDSTLLARLNTQAQEAITSSEGSRLQAFQQGLHYPPNWNKMQPQQQVAYLQQRLNSAERAGAKDVVSATNAEIGRIQGAINAANLAHHRGVTEQQGAQRINISIDRAARGSGGGGANADLGSRAQAIENQAMGAPDLKAALRIVERANLPRRDRTEVRQDVMDQFREPAARDTSGLSAGGKQLYDQDVRNAMLNGTAQPDLNDPKYEKKAHALGARGGGSGGGPKPVMHNGKPYYLHSDGNYYLTP
jgi:hypothetical protein